MHCPNCSHPNLRTVGTFQSTEKTYRTKRCDTCQWKFTSIEEIPDFYVVIPESIRKPNKVRGGKK
jgi:transcriptional regulator NrdR family protein